MNPLRQVDPDADQSVLQVSSLEGYGAPIIDLAHLFVGSDLSQVVGTMRNFIPERMVRQTGRMMRMNIDDGDIFLGEFENGALCSVQTSFVTVGNYPGIEARVYGSKGALICRLVEEAGICETLRAATPDQVEFRELEIPARCYPPGGNRARVVAHALLREPGQQLHRRDPERRRRERRRLRRRRVGAGSDQRRRAIVPRAAMGVAAAGSHESFSCLLNLFPVLTHSSKATTGCGRSPPRSPASTITITGCPTGRRTAWRRPSTRCARCARRSTRRARPRPRFDDVARARSRSWRSRSSTSRSPNTRASTFSAAIRRSRSARRSSASSR